jgi:hypothetical protein
MAFLPGRRRGQRWCCSSRPGCLCTAQDIAAIQAPTGVEKNTSPALTRNALLEAISTDTLQALRDIALTSVFFITAAAYPRLSQPASGISRRIALSII